MAIRTLLFRVHEYELSRLVLRLGTGTILAAHGAQKLFGWFDGYGLESTAKWMDSVGITPGDLMALLAGSAEFFGGIGIVLGLLTRPAAILNVCTMLVALFVVHGGNGFFLSTGGIEFALIMAVACIAIALQGAGKLSLDRLLS